MSDVKPVDPFAPMGVVSKVNPDGSAEVELNENGRALYGENMRFVMLPPKQPPAVPEWAIDEAKRIGADYPMPPPWEDVAVARALAAAYARGREDAAKIVDDCQVCSCGYCSDAIRAGATP